MSASTEVQHAVSEEVLDQIDRLRSLAWDPLVGADAAASRFAVDRHDADAWHFLIREHAELVAAGRLVVCDDHTRIPEEVSFGPWRHAMATPTAFGSRLVVHPDHRGRGLAERIILARLRFARRIGAVQLWSETRGMHAHTLRRLGFTMMGPSDDTSVPGDWCIMRAELSGGAASARAEDAWDVRG